MNHFAFDALIFHSASDEAVAHDLSAKLSIDGFSVQTKLASADPPRSQSRIDEIVSACRSSILLLSSHLTGSDWATYERSSVVLSSSQETRHLILIAIGPCQVPTSLSGFQALPWEGSQADTYTRIREQLQAGAIAQAAKETASQSLDELGLSAKVRFAEHGADIFAVALSSDSLLCATGSDDRTIRIFNTRTGDVVRILVGHRHRITSLSFLDDNRTLLSASYDGAILVWDLTSQDLPRNVKITPDADPLTEMSAAFGSIVAVRAESIDVMDVLGTTDDQDFEWDEDNEESYPPMAVVVLDTSTDDAIFYRELAHSRGTGLALDMESSRVAFPGPDNSITVASLHEGQPDVSLHGHHERVTALAFLTPAPYLASASEDGQVRIWDLRTRTCTRVLEGHTASIIGITAPAKAPIWYTIDEFRQIVVWDRVTWARIATFETLTDDEVNTMQDILYDSHTEDAIDDLTDPAQFPHRSDPFDSLTAIGFAATPDANGVVLASSGGLVWTGRFNDSSWHRSQQVDEVVYSNAKVVLVGDSSAGKTGLALRLAKGAFFSSDSTDAHWAVQLKLERRESDTGAREIWLWDFAGQQDYRLVHQLFMDETSLVMLVFNAQSDNAMEGILRWTQDITRAARGPVTKLLVAGRCDVGRPILDKSAFLAYCDAHDFDAFIETSAKRGTGLDELRAAIEDGIDWERITWTASPETFKELKQEIISLRNEGVALLGLSELRQRLQTRAPSLTFTSEELDAVLRLLSGPGIVWLVDYNQSVLLQPEWVNFYAAAVLRSVRKEGHGFGCIGEDNVLNGELDFQGATRLPFPEEQAVLRAMHWTLVRQGLCKRIFTETGTQLMFPSHLSRQMPSHPESPPPVVTYTFHGHLDEVYARLVIQLTHTRAFARPSFWHFAVEFLTAEEMRIGIAARRLSDMSCELVVNSDPAIPSDIKTLLLKYVHEHLMSHSKDVSRLRHYTCKQCGHPVADSTLAMELLTTKGRSATIRCQRCESRVDLWDVIEKLFASNEMQQKVRELEQVAREGMDNESLELELVGCAMAVSAKAGQIPRIITQSDHGIDAEIEFKDGQGRATGKRVYLQLKAGKSHLKVRKKDGKRFFRIKKERWVEYWTQHPADVMLVIGSADGTIEWMNLTEALTILISSNSSTKQVEFVGEPFNALNVQRLRDLVLARP